MLNRITIMGRLTHDPELRYTQTGTPVCSFSVACDRDYKNATGERPTDFIDCVAWRNLAEFVGKYLTKGRMAVVDGRLQLRDWFDRDGNKRRSAEIVANSINFGDSKPQQQDQEATAPSYAAPGAYSGGYSTEAPKDDGDLPF